ncbi:nucleoside hydrolase [Halobacillus amylolyticus]|uniref:Nucleoside hydrolase n=1 Tax=Halobacillus amylolyticus TaxID=2932259 RepID=A0ABY4HBQ3_9BACI|nr:nucleoside hydrolase [Halobacillus amylolyticus]UOR11355.1 nucleoside hydrolase [Halobacillus amylolyticus]
MESWNIQNRKGGLPIKKKILLFCDPGIDDSLAIMYTMLDPEIELVGIVTSYGNVTKDQATANAAYLVQLAGRNDIPIIPGASQPIQREGVTFYPEIHGEEGIGPIQPPSNMQYQIYPFDTIRLIIERYRNEIIIVDTGRSTTLATAFALFPDQIKMVHSFYVMGGAFFFPGNVTALAEANFFGDPTSSNFVLKFAHNLTITPLNVTQFAVITPDIVDTISKNRKNIYASMMAPVFEYYYEFYKKTVPGIPGAPIHDLLTIILIKNPTIVDYIYYDANVIEGIEAKGMSYIDIRPTSKTGKTRIAIKLHYESFIEEFSKVMLPE